MRRALWRNRGVIGLNGRASARCVVSGIQVAEHGATAPTTKVGVAIAAAISSIAESRTRAAYGTTRGLATLLASLLPALPLASLSLLASLTVARERIHLVAKPLHAIERSLKSLLSIVSWLRAGAQGLLGVAHFLLEPLHAGGDFRLHSIRVGIDAAAHPVRATLYARAQIGLLHVAEGFTQLRGGDVLMVGGEFVR